MSKKFGINDADYDISKWESLGFINGKQRWKLLWMCPYYRVWANMITRCYNVKHKESYPSYIGCTVCDEWLRFTKFKAWMETQDWEGKQLDKDILFPSNKVYCPDACVFVSSVVNTFIIERDSARGEWPIGVIWDNTAQKFMVRCSNPFTKKGEHIGRFSCPQEAHQAWLKRKLELAKLLAAEQDDPRVAKALVERYENYDRRLL